MTIFTQPCIDDRQTDWPPRVINLIGSPPRFSGEYIGARTGSGARLMPASAAAAAVATPFAILLQLRWRR